MKHNRRVLNGIFSFSIWTQIWLAITTTCSYLMHITTLRQNVPLTSADALCRQKITDIVTYKNFSHFWRRKSIKYIVHVWCAQAVAMLESKRCCNVHPEQKIIGNCTNPNLEEKGWNRFLLRKSPIPSPLLNCLRS